MHSQYKIVRYINGTPATRKQLSDEHIITGGGAMTAITAAISRSLLSDAGSTSTNKLSDDRILKPGRDGYEKETTDQYQ